MIDHIDAVLGRMSMFRVVTLVLASIAAVAVLFTAVGIYDDPFTVKAEVLTLAVLLVASYGASRLCGLLWRVQPHGESAVITALLLWFLFWPSAEIVDLSWLAGAAALANVSKYVIAWRGRHLLNPAAAGAFAVLLVQTIVGRDAPIAATWWIATEPLLPIVALGAAIVLWRTRRLQVGILFIAVAFVLDVTGLHAVGSGWPAAIETAIASFPIVFLAGFMLSEPLTLPPRHHQQLVVAAVAAVVFAYPLAVYTVTKTPLDLGVFAVTPELSLLVANLVAFALGRRERVHLTVEGRRQLAGDVWEWTFAPARAVRFEPGQYLELHLPHRRSDRRGMRRAFSISSPTHADTVTVATRMPAESSSFKAALGGLQPGDTVAVTGVQGDFLWPIGGEPLLLVAGGIGITPFLSQLRSHAERDVVLVYGVADAESVAYAPELEQTGVRMVVIAGRPLTAEAIAEVVPDLRKRVALLSGPPVMVHALRRSLRGRVKAIRTDYFSGY